MPRLPLTISLTLRGEHLADQFKDIVETYVEDRWGDDKVDAAE
ncbi:MAG: hypothetical protein AAGF86_04295 [Pseudomonadota bacterium]